MMTRHLVVTLLVGLALGMTATAFAQTDDPSATSAGTLDVRASTNRFLPGGATGSIGVTATAGAVTGGAANFVGNRGGSAAINNIIRRGPLAGTYAGRGYLNVPKFPVKTVSGTMTVANGGTTATSSASWTSASNILFNSATHTVSANVVRPNAASPAGIATAVSIDPWFFTPIEDTDLHLTADILGLDLETLGFGSVAELESFGAFGLGDVPGENVLATWDKDWVVSNGDSFHLSQYNLFDQTFSLEAGQTYWLTDEINTSAEAAPEASSLLLFGGGSLVPLGYAAWRRRKQAA